MIPAARVVGAPLAAGARNMATIRQLADRIASTKNIAKITSSMKMVAASKLRGDQTRLANGAAFSNWVNTVYNPPSNDVDTGQMTGFPDAETFGGGKNLLVVVSSDKGLCGGVNSQTCKATRLTNAGFAAAGHALSPIFIVGDKGRSGLQRIHGEEIQTTINNSWGHGTNFAQVSAIVGDINEQDFDTAIIHYNQFKSAIAYQNSYHAITKFNTDNEEGAAMPLEDYEIEPENRDEVLGNLNDYGLACGLFNAFIDNNTSYQSSQMSAMENATNNSNDVIDSLSIKYNKARQTKITTELCEIVAGAAALDG
jgi:F-type H+-transporting ATPase subunit gamma